MEQIENLNSPEELPSEIVLDIPHYPHMDELPSINECNFSCETTLLESSNFGEAFDYDTNYDILEVPQGFNSFTPENHNIHSLDDSSEIFSNPSMNDESSLDLNVNDYSLIDERNNPIYQDLYETFPVHSFENFDNFSSPVCYDSISNKSTISPFLNPTIRDFNDLGDTYNCVFETGVKFNTKLNRNSSDTLFQSSDKLYGFHIYSDFPISSKYIFLCYVLLPSYEIYSELVDIRSKAQTLLVNLGYSIGSFFSIIFAKYLYTVKSIISAALYNGH